MVTERGIAGIVGQVRQAQQRGEGGVVATIVSNRSELPVKPGARLFVNESGETHGGARGDLDRVLAADALRSLHERRSRMRSYIVAQGTIRDVAVQKGDMDVFYEVMSRRSRLVIVGAGHIADPLAKLGTLLDYEVLVLDDRPEYANTSRFPTADKILVGPYRQTLAGVEIDADTYIVLVTRGHVHDQACLDQVLDSPAPYIGMIGSRQRVRTVLQHIKDSGVEDARFAKVFAPVGLDIGSQTPAEIALAIMAEIVSLRRGGSASSTALREVTRV